LVETIGGEDRAQYRVWMKRKATTAQSTLDAEATAE
jgi:hypothetical protein